MAKKKRAKKEPAKPKGATKRGGQRKGAGRPSGTYVYTDEDIIAVLRKHRGLVTLAAEALQCSQQTIYDRLKNNPALKEIQKEARDNLLDLAEDRLYTRVKANDWFGVQLVIKTLGRHRDYVERTESRIGGDRDAPPIQTETTSLPITKEQIAALPTEALQALLAVVKPRDNTTGEQSPEEQPCALSSPDPETGKTTPPSPPE